MQSKNPILYLTNSCPPEYEWLVEKYFEKFIESGVEFTSIRNISTHEIESCFKENTKGKFGRNLKYSPTTDTLYCSGYGLYVVYEKGIWFDEVNNQNYEIY